MCVVEIDNGLMANAQSAESEARGAESLFQQPRPVLHCPREVAVLRCAVHMYISRIEQQVYCQLPCIFKIKVDNARVGPAARFSPVRFPQHELAVPEARPRQREKELE